MSPEMRAAIEAEIEDYYHHLAELQEDYHLEDLDERTYNEDCDYWLNKIAQLEAELNQAEQ